MQIFSEKYRLPFGLAAILAIGFAVTAAASYIAARDSTRHDIANHVLPLIGDNVQAEMRNTLSRPLLASAALAQDATVRDWLLNGESNPETLVRYLADINQKYGALSSFVASERTRQSYAADGTVKALQDSEPRDKWFSAMRDSKSLYQVRAERDGSLLFVQHRILDQNGGFIGVASVGVKPDSVARLLDQHQARLHGNVSLVDADGVTMWSGTPAPQPRSIRERAGIRSVAAALLSTAAGQINLEYPLDNATVLVHSRAIPETGWRLIAERELDAELAAVRQTLQLSLGIGAAATLLALALTMTAANRHDRQLKHISSTDALTGLMNRGAFDILLQQTMRDFERNGKPLAAILLDIDVFKQINRGYGYQVGDRVLRTIAELSKRVVRENDIVIRWGDEEFLIFLRDCELEAAARLADKLRSSIAGHDFGLTPGLHQVTVSVGVAQYMLQEPEGQFFSRVDQARYEAKASGRNRTIVSVMEGQDTGEPVVAKRA